MNNEEREPLQLTSLLHSLVAVPSNPHIFDQKHEISESFELDCIIKLQIKNSKLHGMSFG